MKRIHLLPQNIISKIAAGEVIERPAFAVKELIENAVDANSSSIFIRIENAGLKRITVIDNGEGMSREDIEDCFKPYSTSKISGEEDLVGIESLGFRGEALSSIAAISSLSISSRSAEDAIGTRILLSIDKPLRISPIGSPVGTAVMVEQLFKNVPARKKTLKSIQTEFRFITDIVMRYAIAFPKIRFTLIHNNKNVIEVPENQTVAQRVTTLLGRNTFHYLLPIVYQDSYIKISGFISRPQLNTQRASKHYLYVNNRSVSDRSITLAVKDSYGSLLEKMHFPVFILFLSLPFENVDVNIHPRKENVSFINSDSVLSHIRQAVSETLTENNLTFQIFPKGLNLGDGNTKSYASRYLKESVEPWQVKTEIIDSTAVTQIHNTYLIVQSKSGIVLIDQHAAHERILYEQFIGEYENQNRKREIIELREPLIFDLSFAEAETLMEHLDLFKLIGFEIEHFRSNSFLVRSVPILFQDINIVFLITETLENIDQSKFGLLRSRQAEKMIEYLACRVAIKSGDRLSIEEAKNLTSKLERTKNNFTCPHGRPTKIVLTKLQLDRMFKRK